jgi:hypothetical protein
LVVDAVVVMTVADAVVAVNVADAVPVRCVVATRARVRARRRNKLA